MNLQEKLKSIVDSIPAELKEKNGLYTLMAVIAERKAFLSKKKLTYCAKFRIDEEKKEVRFTEMLKEAGSGLAMGGFDSISTTTPGFGFKKETYNTMKGGREGTIEEQSNLFGKKYDYKFDYKKIRQEIEQVAQTNGYRFVYKITGLGL